MMKEKKDNKVHIIGAGISGLVAAIQLEKLGYAPVILEKDTAIGGRVQTDTIEGFQLDRGFQVLLEAYPKAKEYLDYEALELQALEAGALLFDHGKGKLFGDPLRSIRFLLPMVFSSDASLSDKIKTYRLKKKLGRKSIEDIFAHDEHTTLAYLEKQGFSKRIIENFFQPFFSGIYLEPHLSTSSRMFEFVYKMFGEGKAMIPKKGMGAIPLQLANQFNKTDIQLNCEVENISQNRITLKGGKTIETDFIIVATDPERLMKNYVSSLDWKSCDSLYFSVKERNIAKPIIGLSKRKDSLVNNIFYPTSIATESKGDGDLLSVTVVKKHDYTIDELIAQTTKELAEQFGIDDARFLKHYPIAQALPSMHNIQCSMEVGATMISEGIAIAGDHQLNGSINAAMTSGELAAQMAHKTMAGISHLV